MENKTHRTNGFKTIDRVLVSTVFLVMCVGIAVGSTTKRAEIRGIDSKSGTLNASSQVHSVGNSTDNRPAILKICVVCGGIVPCPIGYPFPFKIESLEPGSPPLPNTFFGLPTGSCAFINGPYPADPLYPGVGTFHQGTSVVVFEKKYYTLFFRITSTTLSGTDPAGTLVQDFLSGSGTLTLNQSLLPDNKINELTFTNGFGDAPPLPKGPRLDFDGDRTSDIAIFRPSNGNWYFSDSGLGKVSLHFGMAGDIPVPGDYYGYERALPAVYRGGTWFFSDFFENGYSATNFGLPTDIPQPGDYDGDGADDIAVFRPSDGTWYINQSFDGFKVVKFGMSGDRPVAADFDGDGRMDPAVYRNGTWYILASTEGFSAVQFGLPSDIPVPAPYQGYGYGPAADIAVYRDGTWYIRRSWGEGGLEVVQFGNATDSPVPADYDGDGNTDVAVYRSSENRWYVRRSAYQDSQPGRFYSIQFGEPGDVLMRY